MNGSKILVVDDDPNMRGMLTTALSRVPGYQVREAGNGARALDILKDEAQDLVISDMKMPGMTGVELLKKMRESRLDTPFIIVTAFGTIEDAVAAMRLGAADYLEKGDTGMLKALEVKVRKCLEIRALQEENQALRRELDERYRYVGRDKSMEAINRTVENVAQSGSTVLITGESGTGKELVARAIHTHSPRNRAPFIKLNCAAMPDTLIESELFGHEKGSFTGAVRRTRGKFELAHQGTILLDEISEMPTVTQAKLLRVLQEREIDVIGVERPVAVDVRVIATSNRDLKASIAKGTFREDLFFRLNVIPLHLPPLRARKGDIPLLVEHFIRKYNEANGFAVSGIEKDALELLGAYDWPGNIRELENSIERAVVLTRTGMLQKAHFALAGAVRREAGAGLPAGLTIAEMEKRLILQTLEQCGNNRTRAAETLGISIRTLRNKLGEYGDNGGGARN